MTSLLAAACVKRLPPAPTPAAVVPAVHVSGPPAPGLGRIVVDVPEGPSPVYLARIEARPQDNGTRRPTFRFFELPPELVCKETPCVVDHPRGNILLGFPVAGCTQGTEYELVHVGPHPSVYTRSLSLYEDNTGTEKILGIIGTSIGAAAGITGIALLPAGLSNDNNRLAVAGGITLGAGALLTTIGILMIRHDSATYRPGSANHFDAPAPLGGGQPAPPRPSPLNIQSHECNWAQRPAAG
ncbi:MAG: hypothetical protein H0T46_25740 [Deltaproteobacteria bacterium]|nr:hypothetical protein [Deltaproteobacteria bacterium]